MYHILHWLYDSQQPLFSNQKHQDNAENYTIRNTEQHREHPLAEKVPAGHRLPPAIVAKQRFLLPPDE